MIRISIMMAAVPGFLISLYFTLVTYRIVSPDIRWVPRFCRMRQERCRLVLDHRDARLVGVPNSVLGLLYYAVVCLAGATDHPSLHQLPIRMLSWLAVALGLFLTYSLAFRVRVLCPLCLMCHTLNLALAILLSVGPS